LGGGWWSHSLSAGGQLLRSLACMTDCGRARVRVWGVGGACVYVCMRACVCVWGGCVCVHVCVSECACVRRKRECKTACSFAGRTTGPNTHGTWLRPADRFGYSYLHNQSELESDTHISGELIQLASWSNGAARGTPELWSPGTLGAACVRTLPAAASGRVLWLFHVMPGVVGPWTAGCGQLVPGSWEGGRHHGPASAGSVQSMISGRHHDPESARCNR